MIREKSEHAIAEVMMFDDDDGRELSSFKVVSDCAANELSIAIESFPTERGVPAIEIAPGFLEEDGEVVFLALGGTRLDLGNVPREDTRLELLAGMEEVTESPLASFPIISSADTTRAVASMVGRGGGSDVISVPVCLCATSDVEVMGLVGS